MTKYSNIAGKTFGKLTAVEPFVKYTRQKKLTHWIFNCSCGKQTERVPHMVVSGHVTSCGCASTTAERKYFGEESIAYFIYSSTYSDGDLKFDQFVKLIKESCYYCDSSPSNRSNRKHAGNKIVTLVYNGLDRLDSNLPHNLDNVVPCCIECNKMKSSRNINRFLEKVAAIYKHRIIDNRSWKNVPTI